MFKCSIGVIIFSHSPLYPPCTIIHTISYHKSTVIAILIFHLTYLVFLYVIVITFTISPMYPCAVTQCKISSIPSPQLSENIHPVHSQTPFSSCQLNLEFRPADIFPHSKNPSIRAVRKEPSEHSEMP